MALHKSNLKHQPDKRYLTLGVVIAAYALSFFHRFAPAAISQDLTQAFQTSAASLGILAATYFYVYTLLQVPTGVLVDTLGPRRVLLFGGVVAGVGSVMCGLAQSLDMALAGRTVVGLGVSFTFIAMLKIIAMSFEEHRFATLVGLSMLIGNMGSILAGAPLTYMADHTGWRGVFVAVGVVSLLLGVACWVWVRDPAKTYVSYAAIKGSLLSVVKNRYTWPATLVNAGVSGSFFAFGGLWAAPFLMVVHGMERSTVSAHLSVYFTGFAAGCLLIGSISDRLRKRKLVAIVASHLYCAIWLFWLTGTQLPLLGTYVVMGVMGLTAAAFILTWACAKEVNPPQLSGMSTAVTNMGGFSAAAVLQPLVGYVIDWHWNGTMADDVRVYSPEDMRLGLLLLAGTAIVGAISTWYLKETGCRNIWTKN